MMYVQILQKKILAAANDAVPNKLVTIRPAEKPWYTGELRRLLRQKHNMYDIENLKSAKIKFLGKDFL